MLVETGREKDTSVGAQRQTARRRPAASRPPAAYQAVCLGFDFRFPRPRSSWTATSFDALLDAPWPPAAGGAQRAVQLNELSQKSERSDTSRELEGMTHERPRCIPTPSAMLSTVGIICRELGGMNGFAPEAPMNMFSGRTTSRLLSLIACWCTGTRVYGFVQDQGVRAHRFACSGA